MSTTAPYLSLVVAARYDDHGGNFMRRMQAFLNAFTEQCRRYRLPAEIIVVEWNPLPDRCGLAQALEWSNPEALQWCQVRFIEVPPELHARYAYAAKLPLYQMIAKNVGIRRARGEWILATNIDIFFNDALLQHLAERRLDPGKMYRLDRYDSGDGFPLWAPVDEQLAYCERNILRISAAEATFALNEHGFRIWPTPDIADTNRIGLGSGWFPPEVDGGQLIRHFNSGAVVQVPAQPSGETLTLWLEPGAYAAGNVRVRLLRPDGSLAAEKTIRKPEAIPVTLAAGVPTELQIHVHAEWRPTGKDRRLLLARARRISLGEPQSQSEATAPRLNLADHLAIWMRTNTPALHAVLSPPYCLVTGRTTHGAPSMEAAAETAPDNTEEGRISSQANRPPVYLHTNACGDFTLLHRDAWAALRGYPEFDAYSMNIDSVLCWAAHYAGYHELILPEPMRIYHMEHGQGSGWTPEGAQLLYQRIKQAGLPWLEYSELMNWVDSMHAWQRPMIFNDEQWGLAAYELRETLPALDEANAPLRWCRDDPESPSRQRAVHK